MAAAGRNSGSELPIREIGAHRQRAVGLYWSASGGATIGLQQSAEARLARELLDVVNHWKQFGVIGTNQPVADPLMRAAVVLAVDELTDDAVEMCQTEDNERVERFVLQTLDPSLDEGVQVRRPRIDGLHVPRLCFADPAAVRRVVDDRDEAPNRRAESLAQLKQDRPFVRLQEDMLFWERASAAFRSPP
ncbi:MAG: hypothetical protein K1X71_02860 [Pirellulales bacterium]|nr:hypothetical protein [Pirellulales bacterium]